MKLTDFPNEILKNVVANIPLNSDLARVTLVSHRFKNLTEPLLYRIVHLDAEPLEECRLGFIPTLKRTDQLIATLKARPELGRYTTAFSLRVTHFPWYHSYPQISIIRRMPGLRKLSYDPPAIHGGGTPTECKDLTAQRFDFSHVTNHYDEDGGRLWLELGVPLEIVAKHLWGPSVRKVQAEKLFFTDKFEHEQCLDQRRIRAGLSAVEDLRFLNCCPRIHGDSVTAFLNAVIHLRCFVFEIESPWEPLMVPNDPAHEVDLRPALLAHLSTIEELAISTTDDALKNYQPVQSPGSFVQWTALKRLAVPYATVSHAMLHKVLPPQLEELQLERLNCCEEKPAGPEDDLVLFRELAKNKEVCVPGLKRLIWWLQHPSAQDPNDHNLFQLSVVEGLGLETFKNVGVRFEWISTPFFKDTPFGQRLYEW